MVNTLGMPGPSVQRTIVKSQPEVWSEVSDATSLSRHLGAFGEITVTELTPETAVAWEGDRVRGTVTLERSGWGTKVTVTAEALVDEARSGSSDEVMADVTEVVTETLQAPPITEESVTDATVVAGTPDPEPAPDRRPGLWARLAARWRARAEASVVTPELVAEQEPEPALDETRSASSDGPAQRDRNAVLAVEPDLIPVIETELEPPPALGEVRHAPLDSSRAAPTRPLSSR